MARGRDPIPETTRAAIEAAYAVNGSERKTAVAVGVAKTTVHRVISQAKGRIPKKPVAKLGKGEAEIQVPEICPSCRQLIYIVPCRACKVRKYTAALRDRIINRGLPLEQGPTSAPRRRRVVPEALQLELELEPRQQARYEQVRRYDRDELTPEEERRARLDLGDI